MAGKEKAIVAALTFKVPTEVSWAARCGEANWNGDKIHGLLECLANRGNGQLVSLSLSVIFDVDGKLTSEP
jgi:hypothetical protein